METVVTFNTIVQVVANCVGFGLFFMLLKAQVKKRDDAFDKTLEVVNQILQRLIKVETIQEHHDEEIAELKDIKVKYRK